MSKYKKRIVIVVVVVVVVIIIYIYNNIVYIIFSADANPPPCITGSAGAHNQKVVICNFIAIRIDCVIGRLID